MQVIRNGISQSVGMSCKWALILKHVYETKKPNILSRLDVDGHANYSPLRSSCRTDCTQLILEVMLFNTDSELAVLLV